MPFHDGAAEAAPAVAIKGGNRGGNLEMHDDFNESF
jgi:hypothetical protein